MRSLVLALFCFLCVLQAANAGKKCYALVLEGGGDLGAYEAGAIQGLVENIAAAQVEYDVISGVSIGAINAAGFGMFKKGQEKKAASFLVDLWTKLSKNDMYKNFPGGILQGLLYEEGIFDSSPGQKFLERLINQPIVRKLSLGAADVVTGGYWRFNETTSDEEIVESLMCSAATAMIFPYRSYLTTNFIDGGSIFLTDVAGAIDRCMEVVSDEADIVLDIILTSNVGLTTWAYGKNYHPLGVLSRWRAIHG